VARTYSSELRSERSQQTRTTVLAAAHALFLEQGWVATTMSRVAERAGVSRQTVYALHASKLTLLDACIDAALSGGRTRRLRDLPEYRLMADGDFDTRARAAARWLSGAHERSARIQRVLDEAAVGDPAAAARLAEREQNRLAEVRYATGLVLADPEPSAHVVDGLWTLTSRDVWLKLVGQRGWTAQAWQDWFVDLLGTYREHAADGRSGAGDHAVHDAGSVGDPA